METCFSFEAIMKAEVEGMEPDRAACWRRQNGCRSSRNMWSPRRRQRLACSSPRSARCNRVDGFRVFPNDEILFVALKWLLKSLTCMRCMFFFFFVLKFPSHRGVQEDAAFEADTLDLSMQNIAMLLFWWLASNLELAYPSEVYCNLSLMIGVPVIDGGLQATRFHPLHTPPPPLPGSLLPSAGEGISIFEMCFDHQCSQKALTLHCPEMKGISLGVGGWGRKDLSPFTGDVFVCIFHPLKMDIFKRLILKAQSFEVFSNDLLGEGRLWNVQNIHKSLSSASFHLLPFSFAKEKNLAFTTKQIQMLDNEWAEDRDCRNRTVSISQAGAAQIALTVFVGIGGKKNFAIICTISSNYGVRIYPVCLSSTAHSAEVSRRNE